MSVIQSDIKVYGSAAMQESDTGTQGGVISDASGTAIKVEFNDLNTDNTRT